MLGGFDCDSISRQTLNLKQNQIMKKTILTAALLTIAAIAIATAEPITQTPNLMPPMQLAQVTPPAPQPTITSALEALPQTSVSNATFLVSLGMVQNNTATAAGNLENRIEIGYVLPIASRDYFLFGAIQNAGTGGVVDLESVGFGFRKVLGNSGEIYAKIGGEHSSASKAFDVAAAIGVSYVPLSTSTTPVLNSSSVFVEEWLVHGFGGVGNTDVLRTVFGIRLNF